MATADNPETTLFVRKATGLVKGWSILDATMYSAFAINLITVGFGFAFSTLIFVPEGSLMYATILAGLFLIFEVLVYASLIAVMPRAGGDYVWQSRIFGGGIGFILGATGWWFILWHWVPIYAQIMALEIIQPILTVLGFTGTEPLHADWWVYSATNGTGIFVTSIITALLGAVVVAIGMRAYAKFQRWCFLGGMIGLGIVILLFALHSESDWVNAFNRSAQDLYGTGPNAYQDTVKAAADAGHVSAPFFDSLALGSTLLLIPFVIFWNLYPNWGATLYGEVKGASDFRKNVYSMAGGLILMTILTIVTFVAMSRSMGYDFFGILSGTYWGTVAGPVAIFPYPGMLAAFFLENAALQVILLLLLSLWFFGWLGTLFLSSTRMIFAAAFDRVLPEWAARVDSRTRVPVPALLLMFIPSIPIAALYSYSSQFYQYTLDAAVVIAIMYFGTTLAAIVMPWRRPDIYNASPIAKYKVFGIPLITFSGLVFLAFLAYALYKWLGDGLYGVNHADSLYYMGVLYVVALAIFVGSRLYRRRQGIDLAAVSKEIPVE
ncbi:MAG: hypothetical protein QOJ13_3342 [Gaiellales bacterium]|jgi:amino acid transporter|nr:hypothetical protein [Gaiellales bacterium]